MNKQAQPDNDIDNVGSLLKNKCRALITTLRALVLNIQQNWHIKLTLFNCVLVLVVGGICIGFTTFFLHAKNNTLLDKKATSTQLYVNEKLNDIQAKLSVIEHSLQQDNSAGNIVKLESDIQTINQHIQHITQDNTQSVETTVSVNSQRLQQQITSLTHLVQIMQQSMRKAVYLTAKALPFKVIALDSIQGQGVVTIDYHYDTFPIEKDDTIAGWRLTKADYSLQMAEFANDKEQHVLIQLKNNG
ncbi:MAG: hypothetical protein ACK4PR_10685 [Gammaproteobacteria bacterium]